MTDCFLGEIRMFGGNFAPLDWAFCNGQALSISQNDTLYSLIGTTYGGDGINTFNLPDLQGRVPIGRGTAVSGTMYPIGQKAGSEQVTLGAENVPAHSHAVNAQSDPSSQTNVDNSVWASSSIGAFSAGQANAPMNPQSILPAGANTPQGHSNLMPYLTVSFIIALSGIYPTRS